jgi:predicted Rossmann fold nucleotide-binding protein DprA/Smf involved in DNA uptake
LSYFGLLDLHGQNTSLVFHLQLFVADGGADVLSTLLKAAHDFFCSYSTRFPSFLSRIYKLKQKMPKLIFMKKNPSPVAPGPAAMVTGRTPSAAGSCPAVQILLSALVSKTVTYSRADAAVPVLPS